MKFIETSDCEVLIRIWKLKVYYRAKTKAFGPRILAASWYCTEDEFSKTIFYFGDRKQIRN